MCLSLLIAAAVSVVVVAAAVVHVSLKHLAWPWFGIALVLVWYGYRVGLVAGLGWLM